MRYKLNRTLYTSDFYEDVMPFKWNEDYKLMARKGEIFTIELLTDELRDEYFVNDTMYKYIALNNKQSQWILFQENDNNLFDWFDKVG